MITNYASGQAITATAKKYFASIGSEVTIDDEPVTVYGRYDIINGSRAYDDSNIVGESVSYKTSVCDASSIVPGGCIAACFSYTFKCSTSNPTPPKRGDKLDITYTLCSVDRMTNFFYPIADENGIDCSVWVGSFYVDSAIPHSIDTDYVDIVAYDVLFSKGSKSVVSYLTGLGTSVYTVKQMRVNLVAKLGITCVDQTLPNDSQSLLPGVSVPSDATIVQYLQYLAILNGGFGRITELNQFIVIRCSMLNYFYEYYNEKTIAGYPQIWDCNLENYMTVVVTGVKLAGMDDTHPVIAGTTDQLYIAPDIPLLYSYDTSDSSQKSDLTTIATNILNQINQIQSCYCGDMTAQGNPLIQPFDFINIFIHDYVNNVENSKIFLVETIERTGCLNLLDKFTYESEQSRPDTVVGSTGNVQTNLTKLLNRISVLNKTLNLSGGSASQPIYFSSKNKVGNSYTYTDTALGLGSGAKLLNNENTSVGYFSGYYLKDVSGGVAKKNIAIGSNSLVYLTSGNQNTIVGAYAAQTLQDSSGNTFIGSQSGYYYNDGTFKNLSSASNSTLIGYLSSPSANGNSNEIVIGYNAVGHGSNTATIGNFDTTDVYFGASGTATLHGSFSVASAPKWTTPRTISYTGDATGSMSVDGSADVSCGLTLANSGVTAGTYKSVTTDAKGRITAGTNPTTLAGYGITDATPSSHIGSTGTSHGIATTSVAGFLSSTDKTKLDGIATGATNVTVDSALSATSTNPVQNKVINTALTGKLDATLKGAVSGLAELDSNGKVPSAQLPSYVDDVLEVDTYADLPTTGETGKIYVTLDTNLTYRWGGTTYTEISASLALGETSSTAYRGDRGATAYTHSQTTGNPHGTTLTNFGIIATAAELNYTDGVTSAIQTQLDGKSATTHTHLYAGSSSAGGAATTALACTGNSATATTASACTGNAATATKLSAAKTIALTGDITGSVSTNFSSNPSIATALSATGVTAGTYRSVTTDAKGRITAGSNPTTLAGYGITDAVTLNTAQTITGAKAFSKSAVFYGADLTDAPTGVGTYIAPYVHTTYGARIVSYDGTAYKDLHIGAMPTAGVFGADFKSTGETQFNYGCSFANGLIAYGDDTTLPTTAGNYLAMYNHATYGLRFLGYNGSAYQDIHLGAMPTSGVFGMDLLATGETKFNYKTSFYGNGVELFYSTPYIDFHFANDTGDYTSRIIEDTKGHLSATGVFNASDHLQEANINLSAKYEPKNVITSLSPTLGTGTWTNESATQCGHTVSFSAQLVATAATSSITGLPINSEKLKLFTLVKTTAPASDVVVPTGQMNASATSISISNLVVGSVYYINIIYIS